MKNTVLLTLAAGLLAASGYADTILQSAGGSADWTDAIWGSPAAVPSAGNDYVTDVAGGAYVRIGASGGSTTFAGNSLTVTTRALSKMQDGAVATLNGDIILDGGWFSFAPNSGASLANSTFAINNLDVVNNSTMSVGSFTAVSAIDGTLKGSGNLLFYLENASHATADQYISFTGISGYTGALTVTEKLGIEFGTDYTFSNTVTLQDADSFLNVNSGQTLTFGEGLLVDNANGTVAPGTYTGTALDALGANYVNNGGTIVVIPEPATISMIAMMGGGLLFIRRRFMV